MNSSLDQALVILSNELISYGLMENNINPDGRIHRCKVIGDKQGAKSGAYFIKPDYPHNAFIQNFLSGQKKTFTIKTNGHNIIKTYNYSLINANKIRQEKEAIYKKTAYICYQIFQNSQSNFTQDNNYLIRKKVNPYFIKHDGEGNLLIPARDLDGKIWSLQRIYSDGTKIFFRNSCFVGMFHKIGLYKLPSNFSETLLLAEGYATTASIYMATNIPSICCFTAGNIINVAKNLRTKYPLAKLVICADSDPLINGVNQGISKAKEAAISFNCQVIIPNFKVSHNHSLTDFNDLHCTLGLEEVKAQIFTALNFIKF